jgi:acyl-coenzyme A synthetase/AMP-(fatty) acid ligase
MNDCESSVLICSDGYYRSGKTINSKNNADEALKSCPTIKKVVVVKRAGNPVTMETGRDLWYQELMDDPPCLNIVNRNSVIRKTRSLFFTPAVPPANRKGCYTLRQVTCCTPP